MVPELYIRLTIRIPFTYDVHTIEPILELSFVRGSTCTAHPHNSTEVQNMNTFVHVSHR